MTNLCHVHHDCNKLAASIATEFYEASPMQLWWKCHPLKITSLLRNQGVEGDGNFRYAPMCVLQIDHSKKEELSLLSNACCSQDVLRLNMRGFCDQMCRGVMQTFHHWNNRGLALCCFWVLKWVYMYCGGRYVIAPLYVVQTKRLVRLIMKNTKNRSLNRFGPYCSDPSATILDDISELANFLMRSIGTTGYHFWKVAPNGIAKPSLKTRRRNRADNIF